MTSSQDVKMLILHSLSYRFQHHKFKTHHPGILTPKSSSTIGSRFIFAFVGWWWIRIRRAPGNVHESFLILPIILPKITIGIYGIFMVLFFLSQNIPLDLWHIYGTVFFLKNRTVFTRKSGSPKKVRITSTNSTNCPAPTWRFTLAPWRPADGPCACVAKLLVKAARKVRAWHCGVPSNPKIRENPLEYHGNWN